MRRIALLVFLALLAAMLSAATPAPASGSQSTATEADPSVRADFNNDGFADLAIGAPDETVGSVLGAGAINLVYGTASGLSGAGSQLFTQVGGVGAETDDFFGESLASGDYNNDGFADLAVGAPFEDVGGIVDGGAVSVLYGSAAGLSASGAQLFTQVGSAVEPDDTFGFALSSGDYNNDGFSDLAVGAPFEDVGNIADGGAISILNGSAAKLTTAGAKLFTAVVSAAEAGDDFGFALSSGDYNNDAFADLAVGSPGEDVGNIIDGGAVSTLNGSAAGLITAGAKLFTQVGSAAEADDFFGDSLSSGDYNNDGFTDLAVSAPFEDVGNIAAGGAVSILNGSAAGLTTAGAKLFTQVGSAAEADDNFGFALASGDYNNDGSADLAVGAAFEDVGNIIDGGAVSALNGSAAGLTTTGAKLFTQDSAGVPGAAEAFDLFGFTLATGTLGPSPTAGTASLSGSGSGSNSASGSAARHISRNR